MVWLYTCIICNFRLILLVFGVRNDRSNLKEINRSNSENEKDILTNSHLINPGVHGNFKILGKFFWCFPGFCDFY